MYEASFPSASSLDAILALAARIECDPRFRVRDVYAHSLKPVVEVKDTTNGLVVTFSSEAEFILYLDVIFHDRTRGSRYA